MIKYIIIKYNADGYGGSLSKTKTIKSYELKKHLDEDWFIDKKIIPIITPISDWWNKFTIDNKLVIFSFLIPSLIAVFFGILAHQTNKENDSLKDENKTLNDNYIQLKQRLILTSDSLKTERRKFEFIKKQLQSKTSSDKNLTDKN